GGGVGDQGRGQGGGEDGSADAGRPVVGADGGADGAQAEGGAQGRRGGLQDEGDRPDDPEPGGRQRVALQAPLYGAGAALLLPDGRRREGAVRLGPFPCFAFREPLCARN